MIFPVGVTLKRNQILPIKKRKKKKKEIKSLEICVFFSYKKYILLPTLFCFVFLISCSSNFALP